MARHAGSLRPKFRPQLESLEDRRLLSAGRLEPRNSSPALVVAPLPRLAPGASVAASAVKATAAGGFAVTKLTRVQAGTVLKIAGRFNPNLVTTVRFTTTERVPRTAKVIPLRVTSRSVEVAVPPWIDLKSARSLKGVFQVRVDQKGAGSARSSVFNAYKQLEVAPLATPKGIAPGQLTVGYLRAMQKLTQRAADGLDEATFVAWEAGRPLDGTTAAETLSRMAEEYAGAADQVESVLRGRVTSVSFGKLRGRSVRLDRASLALSDQLLAAELQLAGRTNPAAISARGVSARVADPVAALTSEINKAITETIPNKILDVGKRFQGAANIALGAAAIAGLVSASPAVVTGSVLAAIALNVASFVPATVAMALNSAKTVATGQPTDPEAFRPVRDYLRDDYLGRMQRGLVEILDDDALKLAHALKTMGAGVEAMLDLDRSMDDPAVDPATRAPIDDGPPPWAAEPNEYIDLTDPFGQSLGTFEVLDGDAVDEGWDEGDFWFDPPGSDPFGVDPDPWQTGLPFYDPSGVEVGTVSWDDSDPLAETPNLQFNFYDPSDALANVLYAIYPDGTQPQPQPGQSVYQSGPAPSATFSFSNPGPINGSGSGSVSLGTRPTASSGQNQDQGIRYRVVADEYVLNLALTKIEKINRNLVVASGLRSVQEAQQAIESDKRHNIKMQYNTNYRIEPYRVS